MIDATGSDVLTDTTTRDLAALIRRLTAIASDDATGPLSPFRASVERLAEEFDRARATACHLREATDQLIALGRPPSFLLLHDLGDCARRFGSLRNEIRIVASEQGVAFPEPESLVDLSALAGFLGTLLPEPPDAPPEPTPTRPDVWPMEHFPAPEPESSIPAPTLVEEPPPPEPEPEPEPEPATAPEPEPVPEPILQVEPEPSSPTEEVTADPARTQAREVLTRVLQLQALDRGGLASLEQCRDRARALMAELDGAADAPLSEEAHALALGDHAFCSLLTIALNNAPMDDGEWAQHHSRISGELGRDLAIAAARARLKLVE